MMKCHSTGDEAGPLLRLPSTAAAYGRDGTRSSRWGLGILVAMPSSWFAAMTLPMEPPFSTQIDCTLAC